jgi:TolB-like protein
VELRFFFESYALCPERRELTRGSEAVTIGPQVFDLLLYLVRNRTRVVSKDDLLDAVWDGKIVSESTLTSHINAVRKAIGDTGGEQRLVRTIARKGYRFVGDVTESHTPIENTVPSGINGLAEPALRVPDRPSIAVLPFLNLSGDHAQDYFVDGVVEDVISALSRINWLFVIARNSTFVYKGRAVDIKQVGRELGVRYVLEGSLRKVGNRIRITGQLADAATGENLWSERFEGTLEDIFELQDQITTSVVGAIAPQLERAEIERAQRKPTDSLDAYDYYLRGMANFHKGTRDAAEAALPLFHKAIELDAEFAPSYGMAAWCLFWRKINGWMPNHAEGVVEGARLARLAVELGRNDAIALTRGGHALMHFGGDIDGCIELLDQALVLNPNLAAAWFLSGYQRIARGEPDNAIERFARAMRLSPLDPEMVRMQAGMAMAHLFAGRFDAASSWAEKASRHLPGFVLVVGIIAASHALAGRMDEARRAMEHLRALHPSLRISQLQDWVLLHRADDLITFAEGLKRAGLPE